MMSTHFESQQHNLSTEHRQQHQQPGNRGVDSAVTSSAASPLMPPTLATVPDVVMDAATSAGQHYQHETLQKFHSPIDSDGWPIPVSLGGDGAVFNASMFPIKPPLIPSEFASDSTLTPEERLQFAQVIAPNNPHKSELVFPWTRAQVQSHLNIVQLLNAPLQSYNNVVFSSANWQYAAAAQQQQQQFFSHLRSSVTPNVAGMDDGSSQKAALFNHQASSSLVTSPALVSEQSSAAGVMDGPNSSAVGINGGGNSFYAPNFSGFPQQQQQDQYVRYNQQRIPGYHAPTTGFLPRVNTGSGDNNGYYQQQLYDGPSHEYGGGVNENEIILNNVVLQQQFQQPLQPQYQAETSRQEVDDTVDNSVNIPRPSVSGGSGQDGMSRKFEEESTPPVSSQPGNWASAAAGKKSPRRPPSMNKNIVNSGSSIDKSGTDDKTKSAAELSYERTPSDLQQRPNEFGEWENGIPNNNQQAKTQPESRAYSSSSNHALSTSVATPSGLTVATSSSGKISAARTMSSEASSPHPSTPDTMSTVTTIMENQQLSTPAAAGTATANSSSTPTNVTAPAAGTAPAGGKPPFSFAAMLKKDVQGPRQGTRVGMKGSGKVEVIPASVAVGFSAVGGPASAAGPLLSSTEKSEQPNLEQQSQPQQSASGGRVMQMSVSDYVKLGKSRKNYLRRLKMLYD